MLKPLDEAKLHHTLQRIFASLETKGRFFLLEIENSQNRERPIPKGLGLGIPNMRAIAEKYNGTFRTESTEDRFLRERLTKR